MSHNTKPTTYRVYLNDEDTARMKSLCDTNELGRTELLSKLVTAGLRALESDGGRITLPLRFVVSITGETAPRYLNDPKPAPKR
jgi:hypothetical protein